MEHLKLEQIIEFVSMTEINPETLALSSKVVGHIRECQECLDKVKSFRLVYDEFVKLGNEAAFSKCLHKTGSIESPKK